MITNLPMITNGVSRKQDVLENVQSCRVRERVLHQSIKLLHKSSLSQDIIFESRSRDVKWVYLITLKFEIFRNQ